MRVRLASLCVLWELEARTNLIETGPREETVQDVVLVGNENLVVMELVVMISVMG